MARSAFKRVAKLPAFRSGRGKRQEFKPVVPELPAAGDTLTDLVRRLDGDDQLAKRIARLQALFPAGSLPELITYDWLQRNDVRFSYQVSLFGGRRAVQGKGLVPDFVIFQGGSKADIWQIQGEYWHSVTRKGFADEAARLRMLGQKVQGAQIKAVYELWENDILHKRPQVYQLALAGMEIRR